jgi:hypothetical protein
MFASTRASPASDFLRDTEPDRPGPSSPPAPRGTQIISQRVQVELRYAGQIVIIEVDETALRVYDHRDHLIKTVPHQPHGGHTIQGLRHTTNQKIG